MWMIVADNCTSLRIRLHSVHAIKLPNEHGLRTLLQNIRPVNIYIDVYGHVRNAKGCERTCQVSHIFFQAALALVGRSDSSNRT